LSEVEEDFVVGEECGLGGFDLGGGLVGRVAVVVRGASVDAVRLAFFVLG
jgi:hypothetical protein